MPDEFEAGGWPYACERDAPSSRAADIVQLGLCLSRGRHVSNAAGGAKHDERDNDSPMRHQGGGETQWLRGLRRRHERGHRPGWACRQAVSDNGCDIINVVKIGECAIQQLRG
jgi:hypothetical protein